MRNRPIVRIFRTHEASILAFVLHPSERNTPMGKLAGKVAVVTGASKGIGAGIARSLAAEGASVVVNYATSKAGADKVVASIKAAGGKAVAVAGDRKSTRLNSSHD